MKVGILTLYYKTYNFGAQLQAYALQKTIEEMGHDCEQISFIWSNKQTIENYINASIDKDEFVRFSCNIKHSTKIYDLKNIHEASQEYEAFVVGSDQVWGVEYSMSLIKLPVMTLSFVPDNKLKIAYAASFGSTIPSSKIYEVLKNELFSFDVISMREKSASEFVQKTFRLNTRTVLDPVFLRTATEWSAKCKYSEENKHPYIFYYTAGADDIQNKILEGISLKLGYEVKRLGYINGEHIGPQEFISWIRDAQYVVTDSFHATVLSVIFHKQFVTLPVDTVPTNRSKNVRLLDMLNLFGLGNRYSTYSGGIEEIAENICKVLSEEINYDAVERILEEERFSSIEFLKKAFAIEKVKDRYLKEKSECTGCGACVTVCPVNAISMETDRFGFVYPKRDEDSCINCGKCNEVCEYNPVSKTPIDIAGYQSKDEAIRQSSSSGGVFYEIAKCVLKEGGIVAACRYDDEFHVIHDICTNLNDLIPFCQSKYVQSNAYKIFSSIKEYLQNNKTVLFVGTPCQTVALSAFLGKKYERLYLIDFICGGVGAPDLWNKYLEYKKNKGHLNSLTMRYKYSDYLHSEGYPAFSMKLDYDDRTEIYEEQEDLFLRSRLNFYRDSCYSCKFKGNYRKGDITIGDFVGMKDFLRCDYDGLGTTLTIVNTDKGQNLIDKCHDAMKKICIQNNKHGEILKKNAMYAECMSHKSQHYYMRAIFPDSSIERLCYEDKRWDEYDAKEMTLKLFFNEIKRNELLLKTERFISYRLWVDEDPCVYGKIFVYGAGKLGRSLYKCTRNLTGFIDENANLKSCEGIKVYHLGDDDLEQEIKTGEKVTIIVTPVWDMDVISERLMNFFPDINVVSAEKLVGNI